MSTPASPGSDPGLAAGEPECGSTEVFAALHRPCRPRRSRQGCAAVRFGVRPARRLERAERARGVSPRGVMPPLATWETQARGRACRFPGLEEAAAVAHPGRA